MAHCYFQRDEEAMKILHCLDNSHLGGIQQLIFLLYQNSKHEHEFWAADGTMAPEMRAAGMKLWPGGPPVYDYDLAFGHGVGGWSYDNTFGMLHGNGIKCIEVMHSNHVSLTTPSNSDAFISMNRITDKINSHMPNHRCIYPVIEVDKFDTSAGDKIGRLSRLASEKSPQDFLEIAKCFPNEKFIMAGDGNMREDLERRKPPNLEMIGTTRDFNAFYSQLKMFVFPSSDECNSTSVAMAQIAGVPVICQDIPSLRETTGGFALYASNIGEFVERINFLLLRPDESQRLSKYGQDYAKSAYNTVEKWDDMVTEVVSGKIF